MQQISAYVRNVCVLSVEFFAQKFFTESESADVASLLLTANDSMFVWHSRYVYKAAASTRVLLE